MLAQLDEVDEEFQIDQPTAQQLGIERPTRRFVRRHLCPHRQHVRAQLGRITLHGQDIRHDPIQCRAGLGRAEHRAGAGQRHVFPGPGILALIALEAAQAYRDRPLRAGGTQPHIDLIQRARRRRDRQRGDDPLRQAIEIERRAERAGTVALTGVLTRKKKDQIEIGGMGQRAAAQPPEPQHRDGRARHAPVDRLELSHGRGAEHFDCGLGNPRQRPGHRQRIARSLDQLDAQRKPPLADFAADPVEQPLIILVVFTPPQGMCDFSDGSRQVESASVDQRIEQFGTPRQFVRQRGCVREHSRQQRQQRGPRFEQAKHVDRARQCGKQLLPAG